MNVYSYFTIPVFGRHVTLRFMINVYLYLEQQLDIWEPAYERCGNIHNDQKS
jgi:hypothetical protein